MKKLLIILTILVIPFSHIVFAQTVVIRPETYREKQERKMRDVAEFLNDLGALTNPEGKNKADYLNQVKNSRYSVFVEKKLAEWKKKGEFEKTASWQQRLKDSTAIKKAEIQESAVDEYARALRVLKQGFWDSSYKFNDWFYDSEGRYDADKEVLIVNTFWGKIPIPIPLEEAKKMQSEIKYINELDARFFIIDDQLALLSVNYLGYRYENPSPLAESIRQKEYEQKNKEQISIAAVEGNDVEGIDIADLAKHQVAEEKKEEIIFYDEEIYYGVEQSPVYPGGEAEMMKFISDNLRYPAIAQENGIEGRVTIRFVIKRDGKVSNVEVLRGFDDACNKEAVRVVKMMPNWQPGRQNGRAVNVYFTIPVVFKLQKE